MGSAHWLQNVNAAITSISMLCRYGFLLFNSHDAANFVLTQLNGKLIPGENTDLPCLPLMGM